MENSTNTKLTVESLKKAVEGAYNTEPVVVDGVEHNVSFHGNKHQQDRMKNVFEMLEQSEHGKALLDNAKTNNFTIGFEPTINDMGVCSYENKTIFINDNVNDAMAVSILAHELSHARQFVNGVNLYAESDNTKTQIQMNRAMEADAEANAGFVAMELRDVGLIEPWNEFTKDGPEVAKAMTEVFEKNGEDLTKCKSELLLAGFKGWYSDFNIREQYDAQQIEILDKIREENIMNIIGFDRSCPSEIIIRKVCKTPENGNYFDDNKESHELIDSQHYLGISRASMESLKSYFDERKEKHNIYPDDSLEEIPTYKYINEKKGSHKRGNTKSVYWDKITKIKKQRSKLQSIEAIEANKKRYEEEHQVSKPAQAPSLLKNKAANER